MASSKAINVDKVITQIVSPEQVPSVYMDLRDKKGKYLGVIIDWEK